MKQSEIQVEQAKIKRELLPLFRAELKRRGIDKKVKVNFARLKRNRIGQIKEVAYPWEADYWYQISLEANMDKYNEYEGNVHYIYYSAERIKQTYIETFLHELGHYEHNDLTFHAWERADYARAVKELMDLFDEYGMSEVNHLILKEYKEDRKVLWSENSHKSWGAFKEDENRADEYARKHIQDFMMRNVIN